LLSITLLNVIRGKKYTEGVLKVQATPRAGQNDRLPSVAGHDIPERRLAAHV